jgi:hypothetical protein
MMAQVPCQAPLQDSESWQVSGPIHTILANMLASAQASKVETASLIRTVKK